MRRCYCVRYARACFHFIDRSVGGAAMSRSNSDVDDEIAGYLTVMTVIVIMVVAIVTVAVLVSVVAILWDVYRNHGRKGQPQAEHLRQVGFAAVIVMALSVLALSTYPEAAFWICVGTLLLWTARAYTVGRQEEQLGLPVTEAELEEMAKLSTYLPAAL